MNSPNDPAMDEVIAIKEACWREVEDLPVRDAIRERLRRSRESAIRLGFGDLFVPPCAQIDGE